MNTLLIAGFGDIAHRALDGLTAEYKVVALVRPGRAASERPRPAVWIEPGDLDDPATLGSVGGRATHVLQLAPPPRSGLSDPRTANLLAALASRAPLPQRLVYVSTSGVYGDCGGAWVDETRPVA